MRSALQKARRSARAADTLRLKLIQIPVRERVCLKAAKDVSEHVCDMHALPKEYLRGLYLDGHRQLIHDEVISVGTVDATITHPREVFQPAVVCNASAVILVHNHPSGVLTPSEADLEITRQLVGAGRIMGIPLIDHVIVGRGKFASVPADYDHA